MYTLNNGKRVIFRKGFGENDTLLEIYLQEKEVLNTTILKCKFQKLEEE